MQLMASRLNSLILFYMVLFRDGTYPTPSDLFS